MSNGDIEDLSGKSFADVSLEEVDIGEFHPLPHGMGPATQVHMRIKLNGIDAPFIMRFKGPGSLCKIIAGLISSGEAVFPGQIALGIKQALDDKEREADA